MFILPASEASSLSISLQRGSAVKRVSVLAARTVCTCPREGNAASTAEFCGLDL